MVEYWDTVIPDKIGDTRPHYLKWKHEVLQILDLPEYKLRKLWRLNFTPDDIVRQRHYEVYPPPEERAKRFKPGMALGEKRGRALTERGRQRAYAQALLAKAQWILQYRRLEPAMLELVRGDVETFKKLVQSFKGKD